MMVKTESMTEPTVFVVDDDTGFRQSLAFLFETAQIPVECFASAEAFLAVVDQERGGCLLIDVRMPGMSGPQLQEELARRGVSLPIIFMTAYADLHIGIDAMKRGAVDFLAKPVDGAQLLAHVRTALDRNRSSQQAEHAKGQFEARLDRLTRREREVLVLALSGRVNKHISRHLGISLRTIEGHRSRIYLKTGINSLFDLAKQAAEAGVSVDEVIAKLKQTADGAAPDDTSPHSPDGSS
jgi:two-component system response regulator FixJ